jgi:hypothetical protein
MPKPDPEWRISIVRKRAERLGTVTAPNAEAAIAEACEVFGITDPERRKRLVAQPIASSASSRK